MNVHLLDGTYELFRAFLGAPMQTHKGVEIGGTRTLLRSFAKMLRQDDVTHVAASFDTVIESFRNDLFDGYKTGEGMDPDLWNQFPLAERATEALGIVVWSMREFEADDGIATGAHLYAEEPGVDQVLICSRDKDFGQSVIGNKVIMWDRMNDVTLDEDGIREKFGVGPESIPDYLALVGDTADGIPGIARWGAKSTATVLAHYTHVEKIPDNETDWEVKVRGQKTLAKNLSEAREDVALYKTLATLRRDVPLKESLDDLRWKGPDEEKLAVLLEEIGMSRDQVNLPSPT